jgi:hypothetical protein
MFPPLFQLDCLLFHHCQLLTKGRQKMAEYYNINAIWHNKKAPLTAVHDFGALVLTIYISFSKKAEAG